MPFFRYTATDNAGRKLEGSLQANSAAEAQDALVKGGLLSVQIGGAPSTPPIMSAPAPIPGPMTSPIIHRPAMVVPPGVVRTAIATDKDRFFLFSQLASTFRSGLNPTQVFSQLKSQVRPAMSGSLAEMERVVSEGGSISSVMARYPDLYPLHATSEVRAGEMGGFLPDAFEEVAKQAESAHAFQRSFFWVWLVAINGLVSIPLAWIFMLSIVKAQDTINAAGGNVNGIQVVTQSFAQKLIGPWGLLTFAILFGLWMLRRWITKTDQAALRHKIALKSPIFAMRAREEGFTRFSWTMARLSHAGISPAQAWQVASDSVPNLALRDQLQMTGANWLEGREKLSEIVQRSGLFPSVYGSMITTGEMTGDVPGALDRLSQMSRTEFETQTRLSKFKSASWGFTSVVATGGIVAIILLWFWLRVIPENELRDDDTGPDSIVFQMPG